MGQSLIGIIASKFTPEEIIDLPEKLNHEKPLGLPEEDWRWKVPDMSVDFLKEYWTWDQKWYINQIQNKMYDKIYKYPCIETNGLQWCIHFFEPKLIKIEFPIKYYQPIIENLNTEIEMINDACNLAKFLGQNSMLLTYELGSGDTLEEKQEINFETISNMIASFKITKRDFQLTEF